MRQRLQLTAQLAQPYLKNAERAGVVDHVGAVQVEEHLPEQEQGSPHLKRRRQLIPQVQGRLCAGTAMLLH